MKDKATREAFSVDDNVGTRIAQAAQSRGLIARPLGNILILSPTLIMTADEISRIERVLRESIATVSAELGI